VKEEEIVYEWDTQRKDKRVIWREKLGMEVPGHVSENHGYFHQSTTQ
jgi:hypothetical protein